MQLNLNGKKALVTGGSNGIGKAIVKELAQNGVSVAFTSRKQERIDQLLTELGSDQHFGCKIDLVEESGPQELKKLLDQHFGPIDIVVNNIGDTLSITDPLCPLSDWKKVYRLNLEVHVEIVNLFLPHMLSQKWGRIVNITAGAALENSGPVPYCSMKAAYTAYTRSMARVLAPQNVVMSAVLPGVVLTEDGHWQKVLNERPEHAENYLKERTSLKRFGKPEEISPMVVFLCSDLASFCQGSIVPVEGGQARHYFHIHGVGN
jgi:3-oxoacyl-[acyl-carrier protein] reductase